MQIESSINDTDKILRYAKELSDKLLLGDDGLFIKGYAVRLVGVGVTKLDDGSYRQMNLFDDFKELNKSSSNIKGPVVSDEKRKKLDEMTRKLNDAYGKDTIHKGI